MNEAFAHTTAAHCSFSLVSICLLVVLLNWLLWLWHFKHTKHERQTKLLSIYTHRSEISTFLFFFSFFGSALFFLFLSLSFATLGISFYIGVPMCLFIYFFSSLFVSIQFICFHYFGGFMLAFTIYTHSIETTQSTSLLWLIRLDIGWWADDCRSRWNHYISRNGGPRTDTTRVCVLAGCVSELSMLCASTNMAIGFFDCLRAYFTSTFWWWLWCICTISM